MLRLQPSEYPYLEEVNEGILRQIAHLHPPGRVLDVGCGRGALGEAIRALGWEVWGIEQSEAACQAAAPRLARVFRGDLQDLPRELLEERFDILVFSDVLEHVADPVGVLERSLPLLKPEGRVLISLPNAVVWTNRLKWLLGRVEYEDTGVMDRTHLRFFSFASAREMAQDVGLQVERTDCTPMLVRAALPLVKRLLAREGEPRALVDSPLFRTYMRFVYPVEHRLASLWRALLGFRIILSARRIPIVPDPLTPEELTPDLLTVAMITRNEEKAIGKVLADIRRHVPGAEILVVDSSDDDTARIAEERGARVIRQFPPKGYGPAMDTALRSGSGAVVVTLDCDDTYPAERIPDLARMVLEQGYDLVDGSRLRRKPAAMPWLNYLANAGFALLASLLFMRWVTDLHSGMRAYRRTLIEDLHYSPQGPALPVELLLRPLRMGRRTAVVFIDYRMRIGESTMQPLESAWWTLKRILRARFS